MKAIDRRVLVVNQTVFGHLRQGMVGGERDGLWRPEEKVGGESGLNIEWSDEYSLTLILKN